MRYLFASPLIAFAVAALATPTTTVRAQDTEEPSARVIRPALGAHFGFANIESAENALEVGLFADIGSYRWAWLRTVVGLDYLSSSSTRPGADGTFSDVAVNLDLRIKPLRVRSVTPYLGAGLGVHFRSTTASDPNVRDIYDGVVVGAQGFVGALVDLRPDGNWGASGELRTLAAQNINRTSLRLGVFRRF